MRVSAGDIEAAKNIFCYLDWTIVQPSSPATDVYNCMAYAMGDTKRNWEVPPDVKLSTYWPPWAPTEDVVDSYMYIFSHKGYFHCLDGHFEPGYEKIAIYTQHPIVHHIAFQGRNAWYSKLGEYIDVTHPTAEAIIPAYPHANHIVFMCRQRRERVLKTGHSRR